MSPVGTKARLQPVFAAAHAQGRAALIGYLPAGFPNVGGGIAAARALAESGVDLIEIGVPYSDPVMDGPVIQRASEIALDAGVRPVDVMRTVEAVAATGTPVVVMTYWNIVERYCGADRGGGPGTAEAVRRTEVVRGVDRFARDLAAAGGAGLITPDLIPDEANDWMAASDQYGLDRVFLVAPSSTDERVARTVAACRGFVYATSVMGVTGARDQPSSLAPALVARVRALSPTATPVGVGLGVRDGAAAAAVGAYADGVIVGSALVQRVLDEGDLDAGLNGLRALAAELVAGVRQGSGRG